MAPKRRGGANGAGGSASATGGKEHHDQGGGGGGGGQGQQQQHGGRGRGGGGGQQKGQRRNRRGGGTAGGTQPSGRGMEHPPPPRERILSECGEDHCPVCLSRMAIFAVGLCNHHVCAECSTRMRVLCSQNECPICRQDLPKVFFSQDRRKFAEVENEPYRIEKRFRVCFENGSVETQFWRLLEHRCPICPQEERPYRTFKELVRHVGREHERFYCELCSDHLKIFTHERRVYNRKDLAIHKRKGDPDDTSHRGHPLCEFCQTRFMDKDELYRHLRRDHFFCHFCDADGLQQFYPDYEDLRKHFEEDHFLCQEGDCVNEQFTHAFRSEIDLKAHRAERHSTAFNSKADARQNRVVDLEFNYSRPTARDQTSRRRGRDAGPSTNLNVVDQIDGLVREGNEGEGRPGKAPDMSDASFPSLGRSATASSVAPADSLARKLAPSSGYATNWSDGRRLPKEEDFPSLPGAPSPVHRAAAGATGGAKKKQQQQQQQKPKTREEEFPSLGGPSRNIPSFANHSSSRPLHRDIPGRPQSWTAAAASSGNVVGAVVPNPEAPKQNSNNGPNMVTLKKQPKQPAPAPEIPTDDFPDLGPPSTKEPEPLKEKKKSKKKKAASLVKEEETAKASTSLKGDANLKSAADLILVDKGAKKKYTPENDQENNSYSSGGDDWTTVRPSSTTPKAPVQASKPPPPKQNAPPGLNLGISNGAVDSPLSKPSSVKPPPGLSRGGAGSNNGQTDFPALGGNSVPPPNIAEWINNSSKSENNNSNNSNNRAKPIPKPAVEDFPSLGGASKKMSANFKPLNVTDNSKSNPSWGGASNNTTTPESIPTQPKANKPKKAPPGFDGVKSGRKRKVPYRQPSDFSGRNKALLAAVTRVMGVKSLEFGQFKEISGQFRAGKMSCEKFYQSSLALVGDDRKAFMQFFPELLVLLPDIDKQQELYSVHTANSLNAASSSDSLSLPTLVCSCPECGQILFRGDATEHSASHAKDEDFPMLG